MHGIRTLISAAEVLVKKLKPLPRMITCGLIVEIASALLILVLYRDMIRENGVDLRENHYLVSFILSAVFLFFVFRSAGREWLRKVKDPDAPIWGELHILTEDKFEEVLASMERMNADQARAALSAISLILRQHKADKEAKKIDEHVD